MVLIKIYNRVKALEDSECNLNDGPCSMKLINLFKWQMDGWFQFRSLSIQS